MGRPVELQAGINVKIQKPPPSLKSWKVNFDCLFRPSFEI